MTPTIRAAARDDLPRLHPVIERAYRGGSARLGWTHEADLVSGERTDHATLAAIVDDPASRLLIVLDEETILGCAHVAGRSEGLAYLGLLCVEPSLQSSGLGRCLADAAESAARTLFCANRIEMTVIDTRTELIAWYERIGYARTGEYRPFPVPLDPPLRVTVLAKPLSPG